MLKFVCLAGLCLTFLLGTLRLADEDRMVPDIIHSPNTLATFLCAQVELGQFQVENFHLQRCVEVSRPSLVEDERESHTGPYPRPKVVSYPQQQESPPCPHPLVRDTRQYSCVDHSQQMVSRITKCPCQTLQMLSFVTLAPVSKNTKLTISGALLLSSLLAPSEAKDAEDQNSNVETIGVTRVGESLHNEANENIKTETSFGTGHM